MAQIGELSEFVLDEAEEANDDVVDIKSVEGRFAGFSQSDISRMLENDGSDSSFETRTTVDQKGVKGWLQKMKTKLEKGITIDAKTRGLKALGYGAFIALVATVGDEFIDKLIALVVKLCNFADSVIFHGISHAIGHAICIGAGFLISFVFEWVFLWLKKRDRAFDKDNKENNKKVYNELWWRSFWSNLGAFIPAALIGIGLAILSVLTCGIGCVVMIAVCIALGCLIKYLIKRSWDKEKRKYYRAICIFDFKGCHSTFDIDKLQEKYERLKSDANDKYFDANDKRKFLEDLDEAYPIMIEYCRIKNEDGGLIAAKMQAYIVEKEKSECLIM